MSGVSASVPENICDDWKAKRQDLISGFDQKDVVNMDETDDIETLPVTWRNNKKAWITSKHHGLLTSIARCDYRATCSAIMHHYIPRTRHTQT